MSVIIGIIQMSDSDAELTQDGYKKMQIPNATSICCMKTLYVIR